MLPRVHQVHRARARFGDRIDRLVPWLLEEDPPADQLIAELTTHPERWRLVDRALADGVDTIEDRSPVLEAFFRGIEQVPIWVDWDRVDRAGSLLFRTGVLGGMVLGARSLVAGYCSPAGNKPLVLSGALERSVQHRLAETGRFVTAVCSPGGLRPGGDGRAITVRVRLMHAKVRLLVHRSGDWNADWGAPINQHDMLATHLLFSQVFVDGVRKFGFQVSRDEAEDYLHLWRYASTLMGVVPELLPTAEGEAEDLAELINMTQAPPDADARRLVWALLTPPGAAPGDPPRPGPAGLCRALLGDELADHLHLPRSRWRWAVPGAQVVVRPAEHLRKRVPAIERALVRSGRRYWEQAITQGQQGPLAFQAPERLFGQLS